MRAILIDPYTRTIEAIELPIANDEATLKVLYQAIFHADHGIIQALDLGADHDLWIDEEGLLKPWEDQAFFQLLDHSPIAGRGVILSHDDNGSCTPCLAPIEPVRRAVSWVDPHDVQVPAPTFCELDADLQPKGEPQPLNGGPAVWTFENHGGRA
jgi:hypothetical protein